MAGELAQEQCLRLRQGWGGQHGSGSLATLLQARGLCSRGETGEERSLGEVGASHCFSWEPRTCQHTQHELWQVSTPHRAAKIPISTSPPKTHDCFFAAHPFPQTGGGTSQYPGEHRECKMCYPGGVSATYFWSLQPLLPTQTTPDQIVGCF